MGFGQFTKGRKKLAFKKDVVLLCAGSGLTPHLSIAQASLLAKDDTRISMLYCNKTINDIMCKDTLDTLAQENPGQFKLQYTLTRHQESHGPWNGLTGRINKEMLTEHLRIPEASDEVLVCLCGPVEFREDTVRILKEQLDFKPEQIHSS